MVSKSYNRRYRYSTTQKLKKSRFAAKRRFSKLVFNAIGIINRNKEIGNIKEKRMNSILRGLSSIWLAEKLNITQKECRFTLMSVSKCLKTIKLCAETTPRSLADWVCSKIQQTREIKPNTESYDNWAMLIIINKQKRESVNE